MGLSLVKILIKIFMRNVSVEHFSIFIYNIDINYLKGKTMTLNIEWIYNKDLIIYILKTISISMFTYYTSIKMIDLRKYLSLKYGFIFFCTSTLIIIVSQIIEKVINIDINTIFYMIIFISIFFAIITKNNLGYSIFVNVISLSINQILFFISTVLGFVIYLALKIESEYLNFVIILLINMILVKMILKIKKINKGVAILKRNRQNQYFDLLILNLSIILLFLFMLIPISYNNPTQKKGFLTLIAFSILMFVTIQKSLQLYYKQKMLVKDLEETKEELENKKKEVEALEKENLEFSKVSHSIAHKQKSLEHKLNELSMKSEIADELDIKDRIKNLDKDLREKTVVVLDKTGIDEIDDMLSYMQSECVKNKIDFQLQLNGNIYTMINHHIDKEELEILLADHIKNAIIAIGYGDNVNKSILVRLGKIDGNYGLYVFDSGIEFEIDTLLNLGKKPSTTHKDSGGTGMGFMNTFDTLRKHKASFIIEEYGKPVKDNFTKALKFKFDGKNEFKICSYREEEIRNKDKENSLVVEKLSL